MDDTQKIAEAKRLFKMAERHLWTAINRLRDLQGLPRFEGLELRWLKKALYNNPRNGRSDAEWQRVIARAFVANMQDYIARKEAELLRARARHIREYGSDPGGEY